MKAQSQSGQFSRPNRHPRSRRKQSFVDRFRGALIALAGAIFVGALITFAVLQSTGASSTPASSPSQVLDAATLQTLQSVPASIFDAVGSGTASNPPQVISGPALTQDGKPEVLYVGAEFCPFCAAERWPLVLALSRFGTSTDLKETQSAASDVYPNTPTVSFFGSSYESEYVSFTAVELSTNQLSGNGYTPLETLTAEQQEIVNRYNSGGGIPFVYLGGEFSVSGANFSPSLLAGMDVSEVAATLDDANSPQAKAIVGSANELTAAICQLTDGQPGEVCRAPGVVQAASQLK